MGTVVDEWAIRQDMGALGVRIAPDGRKLDLVRYTAWAARDRHLLAAARPRMGPPGDGGDDSYERKRDREATRARDAARSTRDIGEIPAVKNPRRRRKARRSFRYFLECYFPSIFHFKWSDDHLDLIKITEDLLINGGQHAKAMWRGGGKTSIFECGLEWGTLEGRRKYALLLANTASQANQSFETIKTHLETNDLLGEDYPEICYPLRALEGIAQRANAQLFQGERTYIKVADKVLIYPRIPGALGASAILRVTGLDSSFRGVGYQRPDGVKARPDAVLIDDPQTDESARSPHQCDERERLIQGGVLGTAGHGESLAAVMACTVIVQGDLADRYLDRKLHPEWRGRRAKLVIEWPKATELWEDYARIWRECIEAGDTRHVKATAFYRKHRRAMDEGAIVAWPDAFRRGVELSGLQAAWNLRLRMKDPGFFAECQNEPLPDRPQSTEAIEVDKVIQRLNGLEHRIVPLAANKVTGFVDVQGKLLYWLVAAWSDDFTGSIIDYGCWPQQPVRFFTLANAPFTLAHKYPGAGQEAQLQRGLTDLIQELQARVFPCEDGTTGRIRRCLVDANWGPMTDLVCEVIRRSPHASMLTPSIGRWIGPNSKPLAEYDMKKGDRVGLQWRIPIDHGGRFVQRVLFDSNFWKTFIATRLSVAPGDHGALTLWGRDPEAHRHLAEQLAAEAREDIEARGSGRVVTAWTLRRPGLDNHWLDCLVGSAVAASIEGASLPGMPNGRRPVRIRYVDFNALQARRDVA